MRLIRANIEIDVENAATAEKLMKSGFEPLEGVTKVAPSDPDKTKKNLDEMTVEELKAIAIANVKEQIAAAEQQLEKYQAHRQYMQFSNTDSERAYTGKLSDGNSFETAGAVMKQTAERIREVKEATAETLKQIPVLGRVLSNAAYIGSKGWGGLKKLISGVGSGVKSLASGAIQKSSGAFGALIQKFSSGIPTLKRTRSSFNGLGTSGKGLAGILKTVGMTAKFMFASFVIRGAINGAKQGFQNLAQYSGSTNSSISMLMSSLTQLKNSLAAAFAPILEVVAPILNSFVQMIIRAVNAVGQLIGALTGKTTIVTAKKLNQDYAKSLSGTSSGLADNANNADKASKATEKYKRTIMGFDQINKMDDDSSSDSSGGGSSAGNLGGLSDASNMFQTTTVTNQFKDLAKLIKDAWKNADFTELGSIVGEKLNAALEKIPWKKIQNTCNKIAKSIATFLNGFLETTNWKLVGSTIAKGLNTAFGFVNTFAKNFHWKSLGRAISDGINGAVKSFDAALAGQAISNTVKGILDTIIVAIENTDWQQVGEKVREVLVNIDWKGIVSRLSEAIGAAFGGFAAFIGGLIGDAFTSAKEYFEGKIEECGGNVVLGIFKGIIDQEHEKTTTQKGKENMAVKKVEAVINGQTYTLTLNSATGKYEATITAPAKSSYNQSGHYYPVTVKATDDAGNVRTVDDSDSSIGSFLQLKVKEKTAPVGTITYPTASAYIINNKPIFRFKITDDDSGVNPDTIGITIDSGSKITGSAIVKTAVSGGYECTYTPDTALSDGSHTIKIDASDNDGNAAVQKSVTFKIDTVPPTLSITSPADGLVTNQAACTVTGTTNDTTSSPVKVTVKLNSGSAENVTVGSDGGFSKVLTLTEGSNTITIVATDSAGKSTTVTRTVKLDTSAPVIKSVTLTPNPVDAGKTFVISVEITD